MRYQSGNKRYKDRINKRGNKKLRKKYFMIFSMIITKKRKKPIVDYFDKLKKQPQRKPHKVAVIACINKFLKVATHLILHAILYVEDVLFTLLKYSVYGYNFKIFG
ncbi:MAG: transposase [Virgibacillus proomii]|jgi:transposase|nr:transposase [Virgibacillus proomii]